MFQIEYAAGVADDLAGLTARDRTTILDKIEEQLTHEPTRETRNRKPIVGLEPPWEAEPPIWELRVGQFRVFYDVNLTENRATVRAIRRKPPHKALKDIL